jgi:hypothetical protein
MGDNFILIRNVYLEIEKTLKKRSRLLEIQIKHSL